MPSKKPSFNDRITSRLFVDDAHPQCLILDGAMGTELERRGHELNDKPLWSTSIAVENPFAVAGVHCDYLAAGSDIVTTCTYQMSAKGCLALSNPMTMTEVAALATSLAHAAIDTVNETQLRPRFVGGSLGPYGSSLEGAQEFTGNYNLTAEEYEEFHLPRILALLCPIEAALGKHKYVDLINFETFPKLEEAVIVASLLEKQNKEPGDLNLPPRSCFVTFVSNPDGTGSVCGAKWPQIVAELSKFSCVIGIGTNCVAPSVANNAVNQLLQLKVSDCPGYNTERINPIAIVAYPNSGEEYDGESRSWVAVEEASKNAEDVPSLAGTWWTSAKRRAEIVGEQWAMNNSMVLGGCCRSTPQHITKIALSVVQSQ